MDLIERYKTQVDKIAKELNCDVRFGTFPYIAMMWIEMEPQYVECGPIVDQVTYLIALHELGHSFWKHTQGRIGHEDKHFYFDNGVLHSEAQAWNFAIDNCIDTNITEASRRFMWDTCLGTYYQGYLSARGKPDRLWNGNRHHHSFIWDSPTDFFTNTVKRIQGDLKDFKIEYKGAVAF